MKINPNVACEFVGKDIIGLDSDSSVVFSASGDSADALARLLAGENVAREDPGVQELIDRGIALEESSPGFKRRTFIATGVAATAGGLLTVGLPTSAYASSVTSLAPPLLRVTGGLVDGGDTGIDFEPNDEYVNTIFFPFTAFLSEDEYSSPVVEWDFSQTGPFTAQFDFYDDDDGSLVTTREQATGYGWLGRTLIPEAAIDGQTFAIFIRVISGGMTSPAAEYSFPLV